MQGNDVNIPVKRLVLIGGGHAHVHTIKMFGMDPMPGLTITLITRDIETPYSGMIPGFVAGHYVREECHVDLAKLCSFSGVTLVHGEACGLDRTKQEVYCKDGRPPIRYDVLSFDIGISPKPIPLVFQSNRPTITPVKPIDGFSYRWDIILSRVLSEEMNGKPVRLAIVGGGAGGTELCFAMHHRLQQEMLKSGKDTSSLQVTLFNRGSSLIAQHNQHVKNILHRIAREKGIIVELNTEIVAVEMKGETMHEATIPSDTLSPSSSSSYISDQLIAKDGRKFPFDEAIWCTDAVGQSWIKQTGLETTEEGFICVGATLESLNTPGVFACGDIAHLVASPRPKAGVFAVRAGPPLTLNLRRKLLNQSPLEPWTPQEQFLGLIGTGDAYAVASKGPIGIEGAFLWKLKDRIDRTWMALYNDLPDKERMMKQKQQQAKQALITSIVASNGPIPTSSGLGQGQGQKQGLHSGSIKAEGEDSEEYSAVARSMGSDTLKMLTEAKMRCGGCGSKVGAQLLTRALRRVQHSIHDRKEVISGIGRARDSGLSGHDDAALILPPPSPAYLVHTIDYFRSFVSDPYLFGQIAANHALSDIYAMNGTPVSALALAVLPYGPEDMVEDQLVHLLAGALLVLAREECALVGGHTSEGAETALGLAIHGTVHPSAALHKSLLVRDIAAAGDQELVLILTKGLGTGTIMAAHMRAKAKGRWVESAYASMTQSNRHAAGVFSRYHTIACTDVTGFGLMGHLLEMIQGGEEPVDDVSIQPSVQPSIQSSRSFISVTLFLSTIPVLSGATECIHDLGIVSSLQSQNTRCVRAVANPAFGGGYPVYPLLYDPQVQSPSPLRMHFHRSIPSYPIYSLFYDIIQTAGGLLAVVPASHATDVVAALKSEGYQAASSIGKVSLISRKKDDPSIVLQT